MFLVECDRKAVLALNIALLQLYIGSKVDSGSQVEHPERVIKRIKLDDGKRQSRSPQISSNQDVEPGRVILWDFHISIDLAAHPFSTDFATFEGFETTDFQIKPLDKTRHRSPHMQITFDSLSTQHGPVLILDMCRGSPRDKMLLLHAIAIANGRSIVERRLKEVYANVSCSQSLTIRGTKIIIVLKSIVDPLEVASTTSRKLAKNVMYRSLIDEQYIDSDVTPANVSTFNNAIHPPPVSVDGHITAELKTELMQYQKNAVGWMLRRELGSSEQPNFWIPFLDDKGLVTYLQKEIGLITRDENVVWQRKNPILGGLLCDEMGLGKTLEVIALVSSNTRKASTTEQKIDYFTGNSVRPVATTLIVSPQSILEQWLHEVTKHSDLKAYHYRGINSIPDEMDLGYYDIVITSYSVLTSEVHYAAPVNTDRKLRSEPQYIRRRSPLTRTEWWRVIMDEAQMIQTGMSSAAQVACLLPRVFGWIVTGTPISKSCADLFGLLHFLRVEPIYAHQSLWNKLIAGNSGALLISALFEPLSCRNTKALVAQEMQLPPQRRYLCETSLTALEEQNFRDLLIRAFDDIGLDLQGAPAKDRSWKDIDATKISSWVTQLRQA